MIPGDWIDYKVKSSVFKSKDSTTKITLIRTKPMNENQP